MKNLSKLALLTTLLIGSFQMAAQSITGSVIDAETGDAIPYAGIVINDEHRGATADSEGLFRIENAENIRYFRVRGFGYESKRFTYDGQSTELEFQLEPAKNNIEEVEVFAGENPLHRIIRNVIANRDNNRPEGLRAFSYETYSKFVITMVADSLGPDFDTIYAPLDTANPDLGVNKDSIIEIDSSTYWNRIMMETQHFFLMESVTERKYRNPRDHEEVLATRISGLQTPLFVLLSNEMQSFSFYDNYIEIMGSPRVNPVAPGAIGRYIYIPLDTIVDGTDSVFVIQYFPKPNSQFQGMDGELYITTDGWAVKRVIARPTNQDVLGVRLDENDVLGVEIQQFYEKISDHWFPVELTMDFKRFSTNEFGVSMVSVQSGPGTEVVGLGRTNLRNIQINPPIERTEVPRIAVNINPMAHERSEEYWDRYRTDTLTAKDRRTYQQLDSIGEMLDIDRRLTALLALQTGKLRFGYVDYNIDEILRYNVYEGLRLGFGAQSSPKLSPYFSVGGKVAYGFGDKVWKYGYFGEIYLNKITETTLFGGYEFDIYETGGTRYELERRTIFSSQDYRALLVPTFDEVSDAYAGISHRIWPNLRARLSVHRQNRYTAADYAYRYTTNEEDILLNGFNVGIARLELEYAPNDRYMSGQFGLRALETTYPRFRASYEESVDGMFERNFPYRKFNAMAQHQIRRVYTGSTTFSLYGSYIDGNVPYSMLTGPFANSSGNLDNYSFSGSIASLMAFETMPYNRYAANQFVAWDIRHSFEDRLLPLGDWSPNIVILYRGAWGQLDNPESHFGFNLEGFEAVYHEAGLEINSIFSGLGIGFYQRFGAYYTGEYKENAAIKLTFRTNLF
ncbi:MAG: carboxypeptidase-like regulatory domain-containing protein [Flavobacteriia bacterium]|nr:carboxypeptidase-like regulatory domain-containing protein [Flavobacteriia bacterium]